MILEKILGQGAPTPWIRWWNGEVSERKKLTTVHPDEYAYRIPHPVRTPKYTKVR